MPPSPDVPRRSALARISRALLFTVLGLLSLVVLLLFGLWVLNSFDEKVQPATRSALTPPANPTTDDRNLYLAMAGFDAPPGQSLVDAGKVRIARYDQAIETHQNVNHIVDAGSGDTDGGVDPGSAIPCNPRDTPLWSDAKSHAAEFGASRDANREVFARYLSLHAYTGYYETSRPSYLAPTVKLPRPVRCLYLAATAAALQSADARRSLEAARDLAQDIAMWRTVLVGDGTLLSKMLAASELHADLRLAAAAAADPAVSPTVLEALGLQPFDLKDWQLGTALTAEFRALTYILRETDTAAAATPDSGWWQDTLSAYQGRFFKYNATINLSAARLQEQVKATQADPAHYEEARAAFTRWSAEHIKVNSLRSLYNPTGRILIVLSATSDYQLRAYDYAALQRLVFLAYQIRQQGIADADVRQFMATHPEWSTHPVSGKFFNWDAENSRLSMTPMASPADAERYAVSVRTRPRVPG